MPTLIEEMQEEEPRSVPQGLDPVGVLLFAILPLCVVVVMAGGFSTKNSVNPLTVLQSSNVSTANVEGVAQANQKYVLEARSDAVQVGIDPDLFQRQIMKESGFDPNAYSSMSAIGIAQWEAATAAEHHVNPYDPDASLMAAATWMKQLHQEYGSYAAALAAYNAGQGSVDAAMNKSHSAWESDLSAETQHYIQVIDPNNN